MIPNITFGDRSPTYGPLDTKIVVSVSRNQFLDSKVFKKYGTEEVKSTLGKSREMMAQLNPLEIDITIGEYEPIVAKHLSDYQKNKTLKDLQRHKVVFKPTAAEIAYVIAGINDRIGTHRKERDSLLKIRLRATKLKQCLFHLIGVANRVLRDERPLSKTICKGTPFETTLSVTIVNAARSAKQR